MCKITKRLQLFTVFSLFLFALWTPGNVCASQLVPQTWLPGDDIFAASAFTTPLAIFGPGYNAALPRVDALQHPFLRVTMKEVDQVVLPQTPIFSPTLNATVTPGPTRVWAYEISDANTSQPLAPAYWPAVTVENRRLYPTKVEYVNQLPSFNDPITINGRPATALVQGLISTDPSIHWADPLNSPMMNPCQDNPLAFPFCSQPFQGPVPAAVHLHGAEVSSRFDGGPDQWFTPNGLQGPGYQTYSPTGPGKAIYYYHNAQEPGTLWFHDHALGATRTNVYSGMAAFYFLRDPLREPKNLPTGAYEIEMALQDRQFDINGQLFFPDGSGADAATSNLNGTPGNPTVHPFWIPEYVGDVAIVNGAPWPYLQVEPRRYRFRLLNGSNARFYNLNFGGARVYAIGADENYLNAPIPVSTVFIAPGERADVIVDFTGLSGNITVTNDAPIPYPMGLVPGVDPTQVGMGQIMQFRVTLPIIGADASCNPATGGCKRPVPMARLTNGNGNLAPGVKIDRKRQLVLKEFAPPATGSPLFVLVNNTNWDGKRSPGIAALFPTDGISELPRQGSIELWEIINLTADAHPMHTHLTQFQVLNRQAFDPIYLDVWGAAFGSPAGCLNSGDPQNPCPGYGPPNAYTVANADGALGGNPAISPYLLPNPTPPGLEEAGWKDTAKALPGQVTRLVVRWTPTATPVLPNTSLAGKNFYPFDPTQGPGYVWHCHIVDHEDNEMMRPYKVQK